MIQIPQSTARVVMLKLFTTGTTTAATGKTVAITISKNGGAFGNPNAGATNATEVSNGWYKVTLDTTDTATLGDLAIRGTASGCDDSERLFGVVSASTAGITNLDAAITSRMATYTQPTGFLAANFSTGIPASTLATNNDKTGYALTSAYDPAKTAAQAGDVMKVSSGTGANQINLSGGTVARVTLVDMTTTNTDMRGTDNAALAATALSTAQWTNARAGYLDNLSAGAVALASSLATLAGKFTGITSLAQWLGLGFTKKTGNTTARTELNATGAGSGTYDETTDSLEAIREEGDASWGGGGGGGGTDWTANERTAIRSILGVPASGTTPVDPPTAGALATIESKTNLIQSGAPIVVVPNSIFQASSFDAVLKHGTDYTSATGQLPSVTVSGIPDPTAVVWEFRHGRTVVYSITATFTAEGTGWLLSAPITSTLLDTIANGTYNHGFVTTHAGGGKREVASGKVIVL